MQAWLYEGLCNPKLVWPIKLAVITMQVSINLQLIDIFYLQSTLTPIYHVPAGQKPYAHVEKFKSKMFVELMYFGVSRAS